MFRRSIGYTFAVFLITIYGADASAWGQRGHAIVCQTAAYNLANHSNAKFLKSQSFDLGYYCNVPDLVWKKGELYQKEWFNHFMDLEIFERAFKDSEIKKPFELSRAEFNEKFPNVKNDAGRSYWRVREILERMTKIVAELKKKKLPVEKRHKLQAEWLVHAGAIGHYIGDLAQPLHVTENYDGQHTKQKGLHRWFEDALVDELFLSNGRSLEGEVMKAVEEKWRKEEARLSKLKTQELLEDLAKRSNERLNRLLELDRKLGRKDLKKAAEAFHPVIVEQLAEGSVYLGILWKTQLGWEFNGNKFYNFESTPEFIPVP